ncbi:hypothetical protein LRS13_05640 [Svornostia abyssi]|uniref:Uncharacterized protein n=1 Tax=Svornostia abyssi TaxID=2898438 RepID=A0ABY5PJZ2_9ACTN|nr:hypothetical protein LRS13_05640 [Parviterribacteraceae bacterium J379]
MLATIGAAAPGLAQAERRDISGDGRFALVDPGDDRGPTRLLVVDRRTGATHEAGRQSIADGGALADDRVLDPTISGDGRIVAFSSSATNLSTSDRDDQRDVFVHDIAAGTTTVIGAGDGHAGDPSLSADGRFVAFSSSSTNLVPEDRDDSPDIFVHDRQTGTTRLVSRSSAGTTGNGASERPSISGDGRTIAFVSDARNLTSAGLDGVDAAFVTDLATGVTRRIDRSIRRSEGLDFQEVALSRDGRHLAYIARSRVELLDLTSGRTQLVSRATGPGGQAVSDAFSPAISGDGRFVAFTTHDGLDPADRWVLSQGSTYVRDTRTHRTTLLTRRATPDGYTAIEYGILPSLSDDGRLATFHGPGRSEVRARSGLRLVSTAPAPHQRFTLGDGLGLPRTRDCRSRTMTLPLRSIPNREIRRVEVRVSHGQARRTRRWERPTSSTLVLRRLPRVRFELAARVVLTNGTVLVDARRYRGCARRR